MALEHHKEEFQHWSESSVSCGSDSSGDERSSAARDDSHRLI
ncbi:unnamed protein product, partial [Leptidea sinapis]